ncbi:MAG: DUF1800 domain-containing protein [Gammaproteobacteria bacterium]|jgi:uncharacterized protein (DUF1800 family)|nr:DUF1800 domain-containing protein [Gammaproteobacteria bacterium]
MTEDESSSAVAEDPVASRPETSLRSSAPLIAAAAFLQACGGGGAGGSTSSATTPATPTTPPPPVTPTWSPPADAPYARFLLQAQFDSSDSDIAAVKAKGYSTWLDEQMAVPSSQGGWDWLNSRGYGVVDKREFYFAEWYLSDYMIWNQIVRSPDQVRRRIALAMTEYFVVGIDGITQPWFKGFQLAHYYDILCNNAFGNFRKLLEEITLCVAMGSFLNTLNNEKEDPVTGRQPDENYAREVMQLFTLGVSQLNLDGTPKTDANGAPLDTYTQSDVTNLARVFTGYVTDESDGYTKSPVAPMYFNVANVGYTRKPMKLLSFRHSLLEKKFLGTTIPANTDGATSLKIALDTLFNHPNVGPFFSRQMIQRLVTSNPSPAYVKRVATIFNDNGSGIRGDLKAVFKAVLLDDEARSAATLSSTTHGKLREPMLRFAQWARTFKLNSKRGTWKINPPNYGSTTLGQYPLRSPSVFNFFRPGYVPPNTQLADLKATAPEYQIVNESTVSQYINFMQNVLPNGLYVSGPDLLEQPMMSTSTDGFDLVPDYASEIALTNDPAALVRRLNLILAAGRLSQSTENLIISAVKSDNINANSSDTAKLYNVCRAILFVMCAPEYLVQK